MSLSNYFHVIFYFKVLQMFSIICFIQLVSYLFFFSSLFSFSFSRNKFPSSILSLFLVSVFVFFWGLFSIILFACFSLSSLLASRLTCTPLCYSSPPLLLSSFTVFFIPLFLSLVIFSAIFVHSRPLSFRLSSSSFSSYTSTPLFLCSFFSLSY